jgi:hypothetical protein
MLDSGFRRNDRNGQFQTFNEAIKFGLTGLLPI